MPPSPEPPAVFLPLFVAVSDHIPDPPAYGDNPPPYAVAADEPPAYREQAGVDPDEVLPPCALVLHGRFVYRAGPTPGTTAGSDALYQLSRLIHEQRSETERIDFQRLDYRVRPSPDGSSAVTRRAKDVYSLEYLAPRPYAHIPAVLRLVPQSRKTLGEVCIVKRPFFHWGYRALRVLSEAERRRVQAEGGRAKKGEYHFAIKGRDEAWQWRDAAGRVAARQTCERMPGRPADVEFRLERLGAAAAAHAGQPRGHVVHVDMASLHLGDHVEKAVRRPSVHARPVSVRGFVP